MERPLILLCICQKIGAVCTLCPADEFQIFKGLHIILRDSQRADRLHIHQYRSVIVGITGEPHIRLRCTDSRKKRHAQRYDKEDGKKSSGTFFNFSEKVFVRCFHMSRLSYHSIVSTGTGLLFTVIFDTFPFLIWITRSAIGAIARLWVISITVIPLFLQVSCRSFRIAFPVL